jgi:glycosyltransferase involved in cell wall biosynthesis
MPTVVFWGTYDLGKPRVRLLVEGARRAGLDVVECHAPVWGGVEDKSQLRGVGRKLLLVLRWLAAYPRLLLRYWRLPRHDVVIVGYLGVLDVLLLWPFARMRRVPVLWDVFLSLYDTVVCDRKLVSAWSPLAWLLYAAEWVAARAATRPFLDTRAHADYFARLYGLRPGAVGAVPVGAEELFAPAPAPPAPLPGGEGADAFTVLFYGQFIPLHGLDTVVEAAALTPGVRWIIIGHGQEAPRIDARIRELGLDNVRRVAWVDYRELPGWVRQADVCLGIFGSSDKARNVAPNKVYQVLAAGRRVITSDTPAQRELLDLGAGPWLHVVPPGDARALADTILSLRHEALPDAPPVVVGADVVGRRLRELVEQTLGELPGRSRRTRGEPLTAPPG